MAETGPGGRLSRIPKEHRGTHPGFIARQNSQQKPSGIENVRMTLDNIEASQPKTERPPLQSKVEEYFRGRELPTDVWVFPGTRYYLSLEEIDPQHEVNRRRDAKVKIAKREVETHAAVALQVFPPTDQESIDASFRFVGEKGLFVRVIKGYEQTELDGQVQEKPIVRWVHFNEENTKKRDILYT